MMNDSWLITEQIGEDVSMFNDDNSFIFYANNKI